MEVTLPPLYGLAVLEVVLYAMLLGWMGSRVMHARKKYGVPLPAAYENKPDSVFNRYQRAHQNSIEGAATFYITLLVSAIATPVLSAVAGLAFIVGRYLYCTGYYNSLDGRKRGFMWGKYSTVVSVVVARVGGRVWCTV
ncbi:microsomal glutathione S-transferase [Chondrus crispus]|uniref:Microsomal glutathione S-transferase n=1 Tax=Chondrus crispus TaxID=2769 RepID=R7QKJ2_CHOCR|nr:microsomal glutathione S-transferase [Chondrus crispus]CDF37976.1 microsomal glutathione S-transferase [Chondrus crispus]|eukprot:XP_005717845.1 microsomal glutathione S-transferase [Chondrus crispus]